MTAAYHKRCHGSAALALALVFAALRPLARVSALSSSAAVGARPVAVVVGGGPVGAAAALTLADGGAYDVIVYENSDPSDYDATKAFLYNVNARGRTLTTRFPAVDARLRERSVASDDTSIRIVPSDPTAAIPEPVNFRMGKKALSSYWIPRHVMNGLMTESLAEVDEKAVENGGGDSAGRVEYLSLHRFLNLRSINDGDGNATTKLSVTVRDLATGVDFDQEATLVVGADGWRSSVRDFLCSQQGDGDERAPFPKHLFPNFRPRKFRMVERNSPASGLRFKALQVPSRFDVPTTVATTATTNNNAADEDTETSTETAPHHTSMSSVDTLSFRSVTNGPRDRLSLGMLPVRETDDEDTAATDDEGSTGTTRLANTVARPNHRLWSLRTADEVRGYFRRAFPRMTGVFERVPEAEWKRFAETEGTRFPPCARSPGLVVTSADDACGVVLVGDAAHHFPPDLGQGINSGLVDAAALGDALSGDGALGGRLRAYERTRAPETKALVRACRFGSPYQYRQCARRDRIATKLFALNLIVRALLSKITLGLLSGPIVFDVNDPDLSFRTIMRRADRTTAVLWGAFGWALWRTLLWRRFLPTIV